MMNYFNYYQGIENKELNFTDRVIYSIICSFNEYKRDTQELTNIIGVNDKSIYQSISKLKQLKLIQGDDILTAVEKIEGTYFKVDLNKKLPIKENLVVSFIEQTPDKAFFGSIATLENILSMSKQTVISLLQTMTEKNILIKVKQGKTFKYTVNLTTTNESKDEVITTENNTIIEEEMNNNTSVDIEALKAENEALKTRIENAIVEYRKLKDEYYKVEYQRQLLEAENKKLKLNQTKQTKTTTNISNTPLPLTPSVLEKIKWYAKYFFVKCIDSNKWGFLGGDMQDFYNYLNKLTPTTENDDIQVDLEPYKDSSDMLKYCFMNLKFLVNNILASENNNKYHSGIENYYKSIYERNKK